MTRGCQVLLELLASLLGAHGERGRLVATSPELWRSLSGLLEQPGRVLYCSVARFVQAVAEFESWSKATTSSPHSLDAVPIPHHPFFSTPLDHIPPTTGGRGHPPRRQGGGGTGEGHGRVVTATSGPL